jgi:hypothetical protein
MIVVAPVTGSGSIGLARRESCRSAIAPGFRSASTRSATERGVAFSSQSSPRALQKTHVQPRRFASAIVSGVKWPYGAR